MKSSVADSGLDGHQQELASVPFLLPENISLAATTSIFSKAAASLDDRSQLLQHPFAPLSALLRERRTSKSQSLMEQTCSACGRLET